MIILDLTAALETWITSGYQLLTLVAKLLGVLGAFRLAYLYNIGRDRGMIFYELLHWLAAIVFFSSIGPIYNMIANFFRIT